jgi:hypothetical protein
MSANGSEVMRLSEQSLNTVSVFDEASKNIKAVLWNVDPAFQVNPDPGFLRPKIEEKKYTTEIF